MARKRKFYSLTRYIDETCENIKTGYIQRDGFDVPNDFGLDLAVYRSIDTKTQLKIWYVVDCCCGLSVGSGYTQREAVSSSLEKLAKVDMKAYAEKAKKSIETYGEVPGHRIMYLH